MIKKICVFCGSSKPKNNSKIEREVYPFSSVIVYIVLSLLLISTPERGKPVSESLTSISCANKIFEKNKKYTNKLCGVINFI